MMRLGRRYGLLVLACSLLGAHYLIAIYSIVGKSLTSDEGVHLTSGVSYWLYNDYRMNPENGNFPQRWAALPVLGAVDSFDVESARWQESRQWSHSTDFIFTRLNEPIWLIFLGRSMIVLLSVACGLVVFLWSKQLWGPLGGILSLALYCLSPSVLANVRLITSDGAFAASFALASWLLWRMHFCISWKRVLAAGLGLGWVCVSKFSAVFFLPITLLFLLALFLSKREVRMFVPFRNVAYTIREGWRKVLAVGSALVLVALIAVVVIWASFGFRYAVFSEELRGSSVMSETFDEMIEKEEGQIGDIISFVREHRLLPEAFLYGFTFVLSHSKLRTAYFMGEFGNEGWLGFFPFLFLTKSTLGTLVFLISGVVLVIALLKRLGWRHVFLSENSRALECFPLLVGIAVIFLFALTSNLNIGHRHILAIYPLLFVLLGGLAFTGSYLQWPRITLLVGTLGWHGYESIKIFPNYISYFNALIGGPSQAYYYVTDSSIDWGQDVPQLQEWLADHADSSLPIYFSYFGVDDPQYWGIDSRYMHSFGANMRNREIHRFEPGYYAVSITHLVGNHIPTPKPFQKWHIQQWTKHAARFDTLIQTLDNREKLEAMVEEASPRSWMATLTLYQFYRFDYFRQLLLEQEPVANIGNSIFVYHLDEAFFEEHLPIANFGFPEHYPFSRFYEEFLMKDCPLIAPYFIERLEAELD